MKLEQLKRGKELVDMIKTTKDAIAELQEYINEVEEKNTKSKHEEHFDGMYNLCISKHTDGSGYRGKLSRSEGNLELLITIVDKLQEQLDRFESEFESL